jgi:LCP family protein required for cell wall assembly
MAPARYCNGLRPPARGVAQLGPGERFTYDRGVQWSQWQGDAARPDPRSEGPGSSAAATPERPAARRQLPPELDPRGPGRRGPGGGGPATPSGPKGPGNRRKKILAWVAGITAAVVLVGSVTSWAFLHHLLNNITRIDVFGGLDDRPGGGVKGDLNILLVGSDSRAGLTAQQRKQLHVGHDVGKRSDTMILLHIPDGGGRAVLVSLPRDSYVEIPEHKDANGNLVPAAMNKLNASYSFGGPRLTVDTIEQNTHVRIDHYIEVNFLGFVNIVNSLGGVNVCTKTPISDPVRRLPSGGWGGSGLELPAGRSTLNGTDALAYVRAREFDPTADLGRIQRQQKFMAAMMQKARSAGILLNLPRLYGLIGAVGDSLTTDKDFGVKQLKDLAGSLHDMSPASVQMLTVPLKPGSFNTAVGNVVQWDPVKSRQLFRSLTEDKPLGGAPSSKRPKVTIPPSSIAVEVLNSTGRDGFAAAAAQDLSRIGFRIAGTGNSPAGSDPAATVVRYGPTRADSAKTVAAAIPGAQLRLDDGFGSGLQVLLGSDYKGARQVRVVAGGSGTGSPRTAAQDICS